MFMPCPHCGFLVALILPTQATGPDGAPLRCPRCDGLLRLDIEPRTDPIDVDPGAGAMPVASPDGSAGSAATAGPLPLAAGAAELEVEVAPPDAADAVGVAYTTEPLPLAAGATESEAEVAPPAAAAAADAVAAIGVADTTKPLPLAADAAELEAEVAPPVAADAIGVADTAEPLPLAAGAAELDAEVAPLAAGAADTGAPPPAGDAGDAGDRPPRRTRRARRAPSFARGAAPARPPRIAWPWHAATALLGLLLALQLLLAQRHELAASAHWRPWVEALCTGLRCDVPPWREPQAFTMLERRVRPHPARPGVLAVEANFRNDARWPQPWPTLVLSLSDIEGRQVGLRAFAPADYRQGRVGANELLAPGQGATMRLQVREPVPRIVAFTFDFQ